MKNGDTLSYSIIFRGDCSGNSENYYRLNQGELILILSYWIANQYFVFHLLVDLSTSFTVMHTPMETTMLSPLLT